ncbi:ubiquitin carboxyl-terminal hydrolase 17-like isoform X2 [Telopea speciosissima]|uniref:ubiquitin carboxyl-terminal hydrolase 17-like isoform X2 n=1 Tax=Telopea speciosissima TaxID=54955 RepID=UPI001CC4645B|nr:ubiquitin carboxyl-terminal hydrolase 17-like isoform X2 [Telopea speciosissima]
MLVRGDLRFSDLILVFFFFFVFPVLGLGFFVRRKWRLAVARREDIMRRAVLASEEAVRAELEAAAEFGVAVSVSVARPFQCAVCYCPTTTRCSRCKAVRYCSGSDSGQKAIFGKQCEFSDDNLEIEGRHIKRTESSIEEPAPSEFSCSSEVQHRRDDKIEPLIDAKATDSKSESSIGSSLAGFSTSTGTYATVVDVFDCELPILSTSDGSEGHQPKADKLENIPDVKDMEPIILLPSDFPSSVNSVNSSFSNKLKQKKSSVAAGEDYCNSAIYSDSSSICSLDSSSNGRLTAESTASTDIWGAALDSSKSAHSSVSEDADDILCNSRSFLSSMNLRGNTDTSFPSQSSMPKTVMSSGASPTMFRNRTPATRATPSCKMVTDVPRVSSFPALNSEESNSAVNGSNNDTQLLKSKTFRSLSSSVSNPPPSRTGADFVPTMKSKKLETSVQMVRNGLPEVAGSLPNVGNLKTSMWRVVHQFRASKISVYNPLGSGTEVAGKYNQKMIFPYELFIKLYNSDKLELRPFGLTNCGNSCFANAVLQCLSFTLPLTAYLLQGLHSKACPKKVWCFTCEFEDLILKAKEGKSPLSPIGILSQIQSIGSHLGCGREEDAHEFLRYAIDAMQSVCLKEAAVNAVDQMAEETTLVGLLFGGYLRSKIKCMKCQGKSERHERMMDLTVEIQGDIGTLEEALSGFTATETLDGENKYHCGRCKSYEKAKKKLSVLEAPNILTIVLKRFQSGKFGKLNKLVKFPEILNLAPYMSGTSDKSPLYQLYAVVVHLDIMNAAFSGHYVSYVKNFQGKWFKIDDSTVTPVELEKVLSKGAYMLLYARFSPRVSSLSRKSVISTDSKMKSGRCSEAVNNGRSTTSKSRINMVPSSGPAMAHRVTEGYPSWMTTDGAASFESFDSDEGRFHLMHRIHEVDSLSDNSSLFSCSDAGSCSTESTRDSTSTDDFSDYIFGELGRSWNSPRVSSDSDGSSSPLCSLSPQVNLKRHELDSPNTSGYETHIMDSVPEANKVWMRHPQGSSRKENLQGKGNPPFSQSDTTKQCRKSTNRCSNSSRCSSCRETNSKKLGWINHFDVRSGVSLRRSTRERTTQTFY